MAITKYFNRTSNADYVWLGVRITNSSYDEIYNSQKNTELIQSPFPKNVVIDPILFYAYLPANLNYSTAEYQTFIADVNWSNGKPEASQTQGIIKDWNSIESTPVNQQEIEIAQQQWANVFNTNNVNATISFAYANLHRDAAGVTYIGGGAYQNQYAIFFNYELYKTPSSIEGGVDTRDLSIGTWGGWTAMHELGHIWGIPHTTPEKSDDLRFSVMSYPASFITTRIPLTPGMEDIKAMQIKYGLSDAQDGDTNYVFTQSSIDLGHGNVVTNVDINNYVMTISDRAGGGIDTIDASALGTEVYIDLRAGHFSAIGTNTNDAPIGEDKNGDGDPDGDTTYNVGVAYAAEIENAMGGSASDLLKGNPIIGDRPQLKASH